MRDAAVVRLLKELRRRRVFRVAGLYVVALWLLMQAANILFPAWGIPDAAIAYLLWAGLLGFPLALAFGWVFDISTEGIRRTQPVSSEDEMLRSLPLRRVDYVILSTFLVVLVAIVYDTTGRVMQTATYEAWRPSLAEIEPNSVAVLPFADLSPERDQEYFTDGISEEILNRLSAFRELKVIARTSSFSFKDSGYDIARISELLAVNYLLQGSVRWDGEQLRISAQLVDKTGVQVWSSTFDRELGAIFDLQDEIAEAVATSLLPQIALPKAGERHPDLDAYKEYLMGREILKKRLSWHYARAIEHFDQAIAADPLFAEAFAERAVVRLLHTQPDYHGSLDHAERDLEMALALNSGLAQAHAARAILLSHRDPASWATGEGEKMLQHAISLDSNLIDARIWLSQVLMGQGRTAEAEEELMLAARLDPLSPVVNYSLGTLSIHRGEYLKAEQTFRRLLDVPRPSDLAFNGLWRVQVQQGRLDEALRVAKQYAIATAEMGGRPTDVNWLPESYALLGLWEHAEKWQDRYEQVYSNDYEVRLNRYEILLPQGRFRDAMEHLLQTLEDHGLDFAVVSPNYSRLYGMLLSATGAHEEAIRFLREHRGPEQWLAWSYSQRGENDQAGEILARLEARFLRMQAEGLLESSGSLYYFALNSLLVGDTATALERLQHAVNAGFRKYYELLHDPRWQPLHADHRFETLMSELKDNIEGQRLGVSELEGQNDFMARLDALVALRSVEEIQR